MRQTAKYLYLKTREKFLKKIFKALGHKTTSGLKKNLKNILFISPPRVGDVALASGVFRLLKEAYPETSITVFCNSYVSDVYKYIEAIDRIEVYNKIFFKQLQSIYAMGFRQFDLVVDFNTDYHLWPAVIGWYLGIQSLGYEVFGRGAFFTRSLTLPDLNTHMIDIYGILLKEVAPKAVRPEPAIETKLFMQDMRERPQNDTTSFLENNYVLIHPGAHHPTQRWIPQFFSETAIRISKDLKKKVVLIGGKGESELLRFINSRAQYSGINLVENPSVQTLMKIIAGAQLMICNNSGPLHLACALGTSTVSTMGPTIKERWEPRGSGHIVIRRDELPCIGCNSGICLIGTHACMFSISVSDMMTAVGRLLEKINR